MLKTRICILMLLFSAGNCVFAQVTNLVKYVNPISGTAASTTASALKHGTAEANFGGTMPKSGKLDIYLQDSPRKKLASKPQDQPKGL